LQNGRNNRTSLLPHENSDGLGPWLWAPILLFFATGMLFFFGAGFRFGGSGFLTNFGPAVCGGALCYVIARLGTAPRLVRAISAFYQTGFICGSGMLLSYAAATLNRPLADPGLLAIDRGLGYDWAAYAAFVGHNWIFSEIILPTYLTLFVQPMFLIAVLTASGHVRRLEQFVLTVLVTLIATVILFALFPATTAWTHLGLPESALSQYQFLPVSREGWVHDLLELRSGGGRIIEGEAPP
jgi:hypothetical protein